MKMKNMVVESKMGIEYIADTISTCEKIGIMAIADDVNGEIYYYDPKKNVYSTDRELMNSDYSIHELVRDPESYDSIMNKGIGDGFKDFAVAWNALEKKGDEDEVYKTKNCAPIHGNFNETIEDDLDDALEKMTRKYASILRKEWRNVKYDSWGNRIRVRLDPLFMKDKEVEDYVNEILQKHPELVYDGQGDDDKGYLYMNFRLKQDVVCEKPVDESIDDDDEEDVSMGDGQLHVFKQNEQVYGKDYYIFILPNGDCYYCSETAPHGGESFYDGEVPYTTMNEMEDILDAKELEIDEVPPKIYDMAKGLADKCMDEYLSCQSR